ncbi:MAG: hypothetical protein ACK58T_38605, partial [Phycisphaerae bacterium]
MGWFSRKPSPKQVEQVVLPASAPRSGEADSAREARIFEFGADFLRRARGHKTGVLSAKFYSDALMEWSMKDPEFKVQM